MKRVLVVTEAGDARPSGHVRALIYRPLFEQDGIEVDYRTRCIPRVTRLIEQPGPVARRVLGWGVGGALDRLNQRLARHRERVIVRDAGRGYDVIYLQKVASWPFVAALRQATRARLVYDLNDGVWLPSRAGFAGGRIADILRTVDAVTCDNPAGLEFARRYNASLFLVPDPAQVELFDRHRSEVERAESPVVLGWIGSPATLFNLYAIWEPLEVLFGRHPGLTLRLLGTGLDHRLLPPFERVRHTCVSFYSTEDMVREVLRMHVGLFPLFDVQDSLVRGVLKATIYMSGGACVVASPVGQVMDLIADGENGLLASDAAEWLQGLDRVVSDAAWRERLARAGLQMVRDRFALHRCYAQLRGALEARCAEAEGAR